MAVNPIMLPIATPSVAAPAMETPAAGTEMNAMPFCGDMGSLALETAIGLAVYIDQQGGRATGDA